MTPLELEQLANEGDEAASVELDRRCQSFEDDMSGANDDE